MFFCFLIILDENLAFLKYKLGEEIAEVMIEEVTMHINAPASGRVKILIKENEEVSQGQVIAVIEA
jgi:pyruvate/2-oxoglutarate dehydrogenase complex dihydrolipoamide acyltransferase (E2) component